MVQWAYSSKNKSTSAPRVEGSKLSSSSFSFRFIYGHTQACFKSGTNLFQETKIFGRTKNVDRENAGAVKPNRRRRTGRRSWIGLRERLSVHFKKRTIKWLTPIKGLPWCEK